MDVVEKTLTQSPLPRKSLEIGLYDVVCSASAVATLLGRTLGPATELDRALGYESNNVGTSFLGPHPLQILGSPVASPLVTLHADRSMPLGLASTGWDDEGVASEPFTLIAKGRLIDFQTTREQAAWLAPWYSQQGKTVRSNGCAQAPDALKITMQHTPNLILEPSTAEQDQNDLIAGIEHGFLINNIKTQSVDFQCNNGLFVVEPITEIRHGKRVAQVYGSGLLFRASEFWKNVQAVGEHKSQVLFGSGTSSKGEPLQSTSYSIAAVPIVVAQQALIDPRRRA
jgi:TldD protein